MLGTIAKNKNNVIKRDDIKKFAELSRISVSEDEIDALQNDMENILSYVEKVKGISDEVELEMGEVKNVLREDKTVHREGIYSEVLMKEVPHTKDGFVKVRKIIGQD